MVRHGQASFGSEDYDRLSSLGHAQAQWLGQYFSAHGYRFDRVIHGGLRRHRETYDGIAKTGRVPAPEIDARFEEFHYDPLQEEYIRATGTDAPQDRNGFLAFLPEVFAHWERGQLTGSGESHSAFHTRVDAAIDDAVALGGNTLIVTSGGVIGATLRRVLRLDVGPAADVLLSIHNASVHRFQLEAGQLRLSLFNASPHLDGRADTRTYI